MWMVVGRAGLMCRNRLVGGQSQAVERSDLVRGLVADFVAVLVVPGPAAESPDGEEDEPADEESEPEVEVEAELGAEPPDSLDVAGTLGEPEPLFDPLPLLLPRRDSLRESVR